MTFAKRIATPASIVAMMFALTACGGGGSSTASSGPTTLSSITSGNMQDVGAQGYSVTSSLNSQVSGSTSSFVTGVSVDMASAGLPGTTLDALYNAIGAQAAGNQAVGVMLSQTVQCAGGGSMLVNANAANSNAISAGDTITLAATNCSARGIVLNGTLGVTFKSISGTPGQSTAWSGTFDVSYTNFSFATSGGGDSASVTGAATVTANQTGLGAASFSVTGSSLNINTSHNGSASALTVTNFSYGGSVASGVYTYHTNYTLSGTLGKLGSTTFTVTTLTDFKQSVGSYPSQGALKIKATDNSSLTMTAIDSTNVRLDLDKNGDGVTDDTVTTTWASLQSHL